jgi:hypothetical protein
MGKEKLLVPKFDSLHKHVGKKKVTTPMSDVPKGIFYYAKDCQHVKNEVFYVSKSGESVFDRVLQGVAHEGLKKVIQFALYLFQGENSCLDMKHEWFVVVFTCEKLFTKALV